MRYIKKEDSGQPLARRYIHITDADLGLESSELGGKGFRIGRWKYLETSPISLLNISFVKQREGCCFPMYSFLFLHVILCYESLVPRKLLLDGPCQVTAFVTRSRVDIYFFCFDIHLVVGFKFSG